MYLNGTSDATFFPWNGTSDATAALFPWNGTSDATTALVPWSGGGEEDFGVGRTFDAEGLNDFLLGVLVRESTRKIINLMLYRFGVFSVRALFFGTIFLLALPISGLLVAVGLKDTLLEAGVTRMDPISPPTEESPFMDLLAWQVYHLISKLGSIDPGSFTFGR